MVDGDDSADTNAGQPNAQPGQPDAQPEPQQSPGPTSIKGKVVGEAGSCDAAYLMNLRDELQEMVEKQKLRNEALRGTAASTRAKMAYAPQPPPSPSSPPVPPIPPPLPCVETHRQCGGNGHEGGSHCCLGEGGKATTCKYYNEWWSGCIEVQ